MSTLFNHSGVKISRFSTAKIMLYRQNMGVNQQREMTRDVLVNCTFDPSVQSLKFYEICS